MSQIDTVTHHNVDDLSPYQRFQLEKYGDILPLIKDSEDEHIARHDAWVEDQEKRIALHFELQMDDHWNY